MMRRILLFFAITASSLSLVFSQKTYMVSVDDRNAAIELTKNAVLDINNKNYSNAFIKLRESIEVDSVFRETYLRIYQVCSLSQKHVDETISALEKGKRIFEQDDELFFYCGEIYRQNAINDKAFYEYSKAIEYAKINGENYYLVPYYYLNRGNLFLTSEQYESAISDYSYLIKLDSTSTSGLTNRGIAYYKLGINEKACDDWELAAKYGFDKANEYYQKHCVGEVQQEL